MTGDSPVDRRATGHRLQIGSVTRTYTQGPAYLACGSRARVFFYFCRIVGPNEVRIEFHEPLLDDHGDQSHSQDYPSDVQLTRAYAEKLVSMQTQFPCEHHHKEFN